MSDEIKDSLDLKLINFIKSETNVTKDDDKILTNILDALNQAVSYFYEEIYDEDE